MKALFGKIVLFGAVSLLFISPARAQVNLVSNGSFEQLTLGAWGWTYNAGIAAGFPEAADGRNWADVFGSLYQDIQTIPGRTYHVRFALAGNFNIGSLTVANVLWGTNQIGVVTWNPAGRTIQNLGWVWADFDVVATASLTRLTFDNPFVGDSSGRILRLDAVSVRLLPLTQIVVQPVSQTVNVGQTVQFSVGLSGTGPFTYQWRHNGTNIPGGTNNPLTLNNVQVANGGTYSVVVNNSVTSSNALLTVIQPNRAPVAISQNVSLDEDSAVSFVLQANDTDGDLLNYAVTPPSNGILTGTAPNLVYQPHPDFHGTDSFTFKVDDGVLGSPSATVGIVVRSVNDAPIAVVKVSPAFVSTDDSNTVVIAACDSSAFVVLDGSATRDVENDPVEFAWFAGTNLFAGGARVTNSFEAGTHVITLSADDGADTGFATMVVEVITPAQAIAVLKLMVGDSDLPANGKRPLMASLEAAGASFSRCQMTAGVNQLEAFQNKVYAQVAPFRPALAVDLLRVAEEILAVLDPDRTISSKGRKENGR